MPADVRWHFIGHLQSNKARALVVDVGAPLFMVESVDSLKLATTLDKACEAAGRADALRVMLQVNTSGEASKSGVAPEGDELVALCRHVHGPACARLALAGLMTIGAPGRDGEACFAALVACRARAAEALGVPGDALELSMGMSADYEAAIAHGSTNVRVGSSLFGARDYKK